MSPRIRIGALVACIAAASLSLIAASPAQADVPRLGTISLPPVGAAEFSAQGAAEASFPYTDTFRLHSLPGASRVIYLDFNGEMITNTQWNDSYLNGASFNAVGYDSDGNPGAFSNAEQDVIQSVWQRVAEDYAPFNVDVTTEDPGLAGLERTDASDMAYGSRALITNTSTIYSGCGCGGMAWVGVFGNTSNHQRFQPALIFSKGAIGSSDKFMAEAISHEVGHNLGLEHAGKGSDGYYSGAGSWAPIMGASYYKPISQFSKGEYTGATVIEDAFAIVQSKGAPLRADDYGDSTASAAAFPLGDEVHGVITTDADVDVFAFTAPGGAQTFSAKPAAKGANLDIKLELTDVHGAVAASNDPPSGTSGDNATGMSATVTASTVSGVTYYLKVQGVGSGDPATTGYSGYGSVGAYTLSGGSGGSSGVKPSVSVSDVVVYEGNSGTASATFTVSLSEATTAPVTVNVATGNNTAIAGADYATSSATVTIPAGQTSASYTTTVDGDTVPEPHEKFSLTATGANGATIADGTGLATIVNDDGVGISINDVAKFEGGTGVLTHFTFTVTLSTVPASPIGVTVKSVNGTAFAPGDFAAKLMTLNFAAGQKTKTVTVVVKGDKLKEASEQFSVVLSSPTGTGAKITDAKGLGTVKNDD